LIPYETRKNMAPNTIHTCSSISPASTGSTIAMHSLRQDIATARTMALTARPTDQKAIASVTRIGGSATEPDLLHATTESKVLFSPKEGGSDRRGNAPNCQINAKTQNNAEKQSHCTPRRRSLFKQYWGKGDDSQGAKHSPREHVLASSRADVDIRQFSPPAEQCKSLREYHSLVDDFPNGEVPSKHLLPPIPAPLRRWTSDIVNSHGLGMYPLVSPKSILRKLSRWRSPGNLLNDGNKDPGSKLVEQTEHNFELTQSVRGSMDGSLTQHGVHMGEEEDDEIEKSLQKAKEEKGKHTHFDPRIVITEFHDQAPRWWYSEEELACLRNETIILAQQYMLMHPELAAEFTKPTINPITGRIKKRALYSLPVLNSIPGDFDLTKENERVDATVKHAVQTILVVDPNEAILNLFCKSLQQMFPHAKLSAVQTGEDALRLYTTEMAKRGHSIDDDFRVFDIIIAEERLSQPRHKAAGIGMSPHDFERKGHRQSNSFSKLQALCTVNPMRPSIRIEKQSSVSNLYMKGNNGTSPSEGRGMSGSELIRKIRQLEDQAYGGEGGSATPVPLHAGQDAAPPSHKRLKGSEHRALLIGVSVNVERDGGNLRNSGADVVWGKPPPAMGIPLRNRIVSALMTKRQGSDFGMRMQNEQKRETS
jgi:CheY-like chemotaxis protein